MTASNPVSLAIAALIVALAWLPLANLAAQIGA